MAGVLMDPKLTKPEGKQKGMWLYFFMANKPRKQAADHMETNYPFLDTNCILGHTEELWADCEAKPCDATVPCFPQRWFCLLWTEVFHLQGIQRADSDTHLIPDFRHFGIISQTRVRNLRIQRDWLFLNTSWRNRN